MTDPRDTLPNVPEMNTLERVLVRLAVLLVSVFLIAWGIGWWIAMFQTDEPVWLLDYALGFVNVMVGMHGLGGLLEDVRKARRGQA